MRMPFLSSAMRLACVCTMLFGASAAAAQDGVRLSALPSADMTRGQRPLAAGQGFNAANARAAVAPQRRQTITRAVTVRRIVAPAPALVALAAQKKGSIGEALDIMRQQASASIETWLESVPPDARAGIEAVFGESGEALRRHLWERFISGALPIAGEFDSRTGIGHLYNPVIDGLLVVRFERDGGPWRATSVNAVAGDQLRSEAMSDMPKWYGGQPMALADVLASETARTRDGLARPGSTSGDDAARLQARILAMLEALNNARQSPVLKAKFARSLSILSGGDVRNLRLLIGEPALAAGIAGLPRPMRTGVNAQGALATANGAILLVSPFANPGIIYLIGAENGDGAGRLVPVPVGMAMMRGVQ